MLKIGQLKSLLFVAFLLFVYFNIWDRLLKQQIIFEQISVEDPPLPNVTVILPVKPGTDPKTLNSLKSCPFNCIRVNCTSVHKKVFVAYDTMIHLEQAAAKTKVPQLVIVSDASDVVFSGWSVQMLWLTYKRLDSNIIFSMEPTCWPLEYCKTEAIKRYNNSLETDLYVNGGMIGGDLDSMLRLYKWSVTTYKSSRLDDQERMHHHYLENRNQPGNAVKFTSHTPRSFVSLDTHFALFWTAMMDVIIFTPPLDEAKFDAKDSNYILPSCILNDWQKGKALLQHAKVLCHPQHQCVLSMNDCSSNWNVSMMRINDREYCQFSRQTPTVQHPLTLHFNGLAKKILPRFAKLFSYCFV